MLRRGGTDILVTHLSLSLIHILCYQTFPGQLEVGMMDYGLVHLALGLNASAIPHQNLTFYFGLLPYVNQLAPVLFAAPIAAAAIFLYPCAEGTFGDRLTHGGHFAPSARAGLWTCLLYASRCV